MALPAFNVFFSCTLFLALASGCQPAPQRDCERFASGSFQFTAIIGADTLHSVLERNKTFEIEYFQGKRDTSMIRWINSCEYILKKKHPKNRAEEKSVHVKILSTTDSSYTFEFSAVDEPKKLRGTAQRIK